MSRPALTLTLQPVPPVLDDEELAALAMHAMHDSYDVAGHRDQIEQLAYGVMCLGAELGLERERLRAEQASHQVELARCQAEMVSARRMLSEAEANGAAARTTIAQLQQELLFVRCELAIRRLVDAYLADVEMPDRAPAGRASGRLGGRS